MSREVFMLDLLILVGFICFVFGLGSAFLISRDGFNVRHPWTWVKHTYTLRRWLTNPIKMFQLGMLWQTNFQQLMLTGPVLSLAAELDYRTRLFLVLGNLVGGCICFYGLHLRDYELSLWVETAGYLALISTLGIWIVQVYMTVPLPNVSYGLNLAEGLVLALALIRVPEVLLYKRALRKGDVEKAAKLRVLLGGNGG